MRGSLWGRGVVGSGRAICGTEWTQSLSLTTHPARHAAPRNRARRPRVARPGGRPRGPSRSGEQPVPHLLRRALLQHILLHGHGPRGGPACRALPGPGQRRGRPGRTAPPPAGREGGGGGRSRAPRASGETLPESATAAASDPLRPASQSRWSAAARLMGAGEGKHEQAGPRHAFATQLRLTAPGDHCRPAASGWRERPPGMALSSSRRDSASISL